MTENIFTVGRNSSQRGAVRIPGLPILPPNTERHSIPGGGTRVVELKSGDEITIVDPEGLQGCEFAVFDQHGRSDPAMVGAVKTAATIGLRSILASAESSAKYVHRALAAHGLNLADASVTRLFGDDSTAGSNQRFTANSDLILIIGAPGKPMLVFDQNPPTPVILYIRRANGLNAKSVNDPPPPFAEPLSDTNIAPGTATAYEVKAGQYIQIVDVKGRQCSDFQAFSLPALDRGLERELDPTTTRSLTGLLYPSPGLYSKYFNVDHEPMIQIVQDTCGRHDMFGLACTARYYADMGYPGHINCSDNISVAVEPFGIRRRGGWPAINFFFNTMLDATNAISMDDPWSRPGDFVLLRALTDLLCVSTACPCDVDPANGWNPTDIQVRIYAAAKDFKPATGFRMTTDADLQMTQKTGFHDCFAAHTRNFVEYNGYWLAQDFPAHRAIAEYWCCREKAVIMDLSPLRKYEVLGPDAEALMQLCLTRNIRKLSVGQVVYSAMCYEHGGMIDDGTLFRLGENNFRWIGGTDQSGLWMRKQAIKRGMDVWVKTSTSQLCNVAVQGPKSRDIMARLIWTAPSQPDMAELNWFRFTIGRLHDFHGIALVISRTGYTGELGYEIFCHPRDARSLFDAVMQAGEEYGITPIGLDALNLLRIEAGLMFANNEFCDQTDPFEAGIGFTVPLKSKADDFIGKNALLRRQANPSRELVGLDIEGGIVPVTGDGIYIDRAQVGAITSAIRSPILGKTIALCRVDVTYSALGTAVEVGQLDGQQKRIPARVVAFPHFDPQKQRVRGHYA